MNMLSQALRYCQWEAVALSWPSMHDMGEIRKGKGAKLQVQLEVDYKKAQTTC